MSATIFKNGRRSDVSQIGEKFRKADVSRRSSRGLVQGVGHLNGISRSDTPAANIP